MSRRQPIPNPPAPVSLGPCPRILVVKLAGLGDLLLMTPALRALRARYPAGRIDLLVTPESAALLRDSPLIDALHVIEKHAYDEPTRLLRHPARLASVRRPLLALRHQRYDALLLMHHLTLPFGRLKYRALLMAVAPHLTVGLDNGYGGFLDLRVPDEGFGVRHEAEYALVLVAALDACLPRGDRGLRLGDLGWSAEWDACHAGAAPMLAARVMPGASARQPRVPLVALHPGGGGYSLARRWPAERFAEVALALHRETGADCILVGGAEEHALQTEILARLGAPSWARSRAGATDPAALARLLATCALFVGNDSLPMHLATAVGTPVVAIFGPSNARAWGPYVPDAHGQALVVRHDLACSPCIYRGHALGTPQGCPGRPCLTALSALEVLAAARRLLSRVGVADPPAD